MGINVSDIDAELKRREAMSSGGGVSSGSPSVSDIDAELVRRGATYSQPMGQVASEAAKTAITGPYDATKAMLDNPEAVRQQAPIVGAVLGGPIGAGVGQIAKRVAGMAYGTEPPSGTPMQEAIAPMVQTAVAGLPEVTGVKNAVQSTAQNLGRRALGFTKGMLKRTPGGVPQANQVAQKMLDEGVIQPFSGTQGTLDRAKELAATSGQAVGKALSQSGQSALDTNAVGEEISKQLAPTFSGGAYDAENKVVGEILDTVGAHGNGPIDFQSAQALKEKLEEIARFNSSTDAMKAKLYRRAYGIVSDAIEKGVAEVNPTGLPDYIANKSTYGASQRAIQGLSDKANAEASNSVLSLRGAAIGAGALASGHITPALEALGAWEAARRYGSSFGSATLNAANKLPVMDAARRVAFASFIDKFTTK